jgi:hypothetical protein
MPTASALLHICGSLEGPHRRTHTRQTKQMALAVRYAVVKIEGLQDLEGKSIAISGSEFAKHGHREAIYELGAEILRLSQLSEADAKN